MDVDDLERLEDRLDAYLARFGDCFRRSDTRVHLTTYVRGQLSDLDAKSVEPIALRAGTPVRTLQEFLAQHRWDEDGLRRRLIHIIRDEHVTGRDQKFVLEVPRTFSVWEKAPEVTEQPYRKGGRGRGRKTPRVKSGESSPRSVETVFWHGEAMKAKRWKRYRVKDGEKGPIIWEAKRVRVTLKGSDGLPGMSLWLVVARNVLDGELKFFVSNASEFTSMALLLQVAFQRWRVERCFEDQKQEVGLDGYEGRRYLGLKRHLIITSISYLFLSQTCEQERKEIRSGPFSRFATWSTRSLSAGRFGAKVAAPCLSRLARGSARRIDAAISREVEFRPAESMAGIEL